MVDDFDLFGPDENGDADATTAAETATDSQETATEDTALGPESQSPPPLAEDKDDATESTEDATDESPPLVVPPQVVPKVVRIGLQELASLIGVDSSTAKRWLDEGLLPEPIERSEYQSGLRWDKTALEPWITSTAKRLAKAKGKVSKL